MNNQTLNDLLSYHQPLDDTDFKQKIIKQIKAKDKIRRLIMWTCSFLGLIISLIYLWSVLPSDVIPDLMSPINGVLLSSIGLFVVWLWTEALADN